jgi:hypothetical protein
VLQLSGTDSSRKTGRESNQHAAPRCQLLLNIAHMVAIFRAIPANSAVKLSSAWIGLSNIAQQNIKTRINMRLRSIAGRLFLEHIGGSVEMVQSPPETRALAHLLARYREPDSLRGVFELVITAVPFLVIWALMWTALDHGYWIGLLLVVPAAGLLVRLFMIQHDCGHGSFFHGRLANHWVGRAIGVVTLTPYDYWRRSHAFHHASSGNLDHRGIGDIDTSDPLPSVPASDRDVRYRSHVSVHFAASLADRDDAKRLGALAKYNGHERRDRDSGRRDGPAGRLWAVPACAPADLGPGGVDRCLAVLCPTSVRGHFLVP